MSEPRYIDRPPRIQPELPHKKIEIPAPPQRPDNTGLILMQVALPIVTIIGFVLVAAMGGRGQGVALFVLPMFFAVVATAAFSWYMYKRQEKNMARQEAAYRERLLELRQEMVNQHEIQRRFYHFNYPDTATVLRIADDTHREPGKQQASIRSGSRLWERRPTDEDFGFIRLGIGAIPSTTIYEFTRPENFEDELTREAMRLDDDSRFVADTPVAIALRPFPEKGVPENDDPQEEERPPWPIPVTHATGIAGQPDDVYSFTWAMLAHFVTFHAATDARLFIISPTRQPWEWAYSLAHCQPDDHNDYLCFEDETAVDDAGSDEDVEGRTNRFLEDLRKLLAQRELMLKESETTGNIQDPRNPLLLVVIDLLAPAGDGSPLNSLETDAAISLLVSQGAELGGSIIFLVPERSKVPGGCVSVIEIESVVPDGHAQATPFFRYAEVGLNSWRYVGRADTVPRETIIDFANKLDALDARKSYGGSLVTTVPFMGMMGETTLEGLRESTLRAWERNRLGQSADWLKVKLGLMSGNKSRTLIFSAKKDGVHGMVAGSTGSGKSELLISMIAGLAVNYDPTTLNFVLVDYKGGGAFEDFRELPHCVDIITNLQGAGVVRMFTAINSELKRRQALNVESGTKDIVEYRRRGYHLTRAPYPFLFIIIDEFAEMIAESPEFKTELERITRVGRAQGVSLILAAQRPSGVTDQMRSNIKFRICLRVEGADESREMLRRPDAAYLPSNIPGRGYLQIGNDNIESIQIAYTGDKYVDPARRQRLNVIWPGRPRRSPIEDQDAPKVYQSIIAMLKKLAQTEATAEQKAPWPEYLPADLSLTGEIKREKLARIDSITLGRELGSALSLNPAVNRWLNHEKEPDDEIWKGISWDKYAMRPVVGLIDDPYEARRLPLVINMPRGHVVLFGASGWGKTNFLRTLIISLVATHAPHELSIFILDLGGRNLKPMSDFPHVGAVILPDEEGYEEQVQQLLRELSIVVEKRKKLLSDEGVDSIYRYNVLHPQSPMPAMLVAIDNFVEFRESFESRGGGEEGLLGEFISLARESRVYGIHFVITIDNVGALPNKLFNIFTERLTLKLPEAADYRTVTGTSVPELEDIPGRGYIKIGRRPLAFQIALPVDTRREDAGTPVSEGQEIRQLAASMKEEIDETRTTQSILRVAPLPRTVSYRQMIARKDGIALTDNFMEILQERTRECWSHSILADHADWPTVNLGMMTGNRPRILKLASDFDGVHGMIAGGTGSGKSELLMTMIVDLALNHDPSVLNFVLVDYKGGGAFKPFERLPHVVDIITNLQTGGVVRMFTAINAELKRRQKLNADTGTKDIIEYRRKGLHLDSQKGPYPHLVIIIDEYAEMISAMPEFKQELDSITRVGRASGVNLILAAQRPTGVTDQMRSNIKFRICLRVEGIDESREMLRRPDAALLPGNIPGRGYLQIGNEDIELIQVGFTGEKEPETKPAAVLWPERPPRPAYSVARTEVPRLYDRVVSLTGALLGEKEKPNALPRRPWPDFLPDYLTLQLLQEVEYLDFEDRLKLRLGQAGSEPLIPLNPSITDWQNGEGSWPGIDWKKYALRPVIGLIDQPSNARRLPFVLNLAQFHVAVFGDSGWGKTTLLRTVLAALTSTHSPAELNVFVLDLGGRNFTVFAPLPHVADIIMPDDEEFEERVNRLVDRLSQEVDRRRLLFSAADSSNLYDYNAKNPNNIEPALLVMIDNFAGLNDPFEALIHNELIALAQNGRTYGLCFLVTANTPQTIPGKLYNLFGERLVMRMADSSQYSDIVGRGAVELDAIPGRGYVRVGRQPLEFQVAMPVGLSGDQADTTREINLLRELVNAMSEGWDGPRPAPILTLPKKVSFKDVLTQAEKNDRTPVVIRGVLGQGADLQPAEIDLQKNGPHFVVAGPPQSGKTTVMRNFVLSLAHRYPPQQAPMILIDTRRKFFNHGGDRRLDELPHVLEAITDIEALEPLIVQLKAEYDLAIAERQPRRIFVLIDNFDDFNEELSSGFNSDLANALSTLAHRFGTEGLHFVVAGNIDSASDLRRRIESNGYGFALRTEDALQKLSVTRIPGSLRDTELAVGRGFTAKSGQLALVQAASPMFDFIDEPAASEDEVLAAAMDAWIDAILERYPQERASWWASPPADTDSPEQGSGGLAGTMSVSPSIVTLLRNAIQIELNRQGLGLGLVPLSDDREVFEMAQGLFGELPVQDQEVSPEGEEDSEEFTLDLDFETDDILDAMEPPE